MEWHTRLSSLHTEGYNRLRVEDYGGTVIIIRIKHNFGRVPGFRIITAAPYRVFGSIISEILVGAGWRVERFAKGRAVESGLNANYGTSIPPPPPPTPSSPRGTLIRPK